MAKESIAERRAIRDVVVSPAATSSAGDLTEAQLDEALDVLAMARPPAVAAGPLPTTATRSP